MENNKIYVGSEIDPLQKVIVHRPDEGIARISPKRAEELLFDDIVHLPKMQEEHDEFTDVLRLLLGDEQVYEAADLLREALEANAELKGEFLQMVVDYEELPLSYLEMMNELDPKDLAEVLITGYHKKRDRFLFDPIPNFIFTRDIATVVHDHVIITKAAKTARQRENLLTRFIFSAHPMFRILHEENRVINLNRINEFPPSKQGERVSVEGGDLMVIQGDYLLIGCSERTTEYAFHSIKRALFERAVIKHVVQVTVPADRSFMHIDTLFTRISDRHLVNYKPIVYDGLSSKVEVHDLNGGERHYPSVREFFLEEINPDMQFIFTGMGRSPFQEREQWTDGCNLVALKPGLALTYDRNRWTETAFRKHDFEILPAEQLFRRATASDWNPEDIEQTIITLPSNELSRARGGSHCMTCPLLRKS